MRVFKWVLLIFGVVVIFGSGLVAGVVVCGRDPVALWTSILETRQAPKAEAKVLGPEKSNSTYRTDLVRRKEERPQVGRPPAEVDEMEKDPEKIVVDHYRQLLKKSMGVDYQESPEAKKRVNNIYNNYGREKTK